MENSSPREVVLLKHPKTTQHSLALQIEADITKNRGDVRYYDPTLSCLFKEYKQEIRNSGAAANVPVDIHEFDLFHATPSYRRERLLQSADIFATIDPSPELAIYLAKVMRANPLTQAVLALSSQKEDVELEEHVRMLSTLSFTSFTKEERAIAEHEGIATLETSFTKNETPRVFVCQLHQRRALRKILCESLRMSRAAG